MSSDLHDEIDVLIDDVTPHGTLPTRDVVVERVPQLNVLVWYELATDGTFAMKTVYRHVGSPLI